jgi:aminoglycoside/choline kinase family phosphotransferase
MSELTEPAAELRAAADSLLKTPGVELRPLTPEASARRYYRPQPECGWLLVWSSAPPPQATALWLRGCGVRVPALGAAQKTKMSGNPEGWTYLVEDLGDALFQNCPDANSYSALLQSWERFAFRPLPAGHPQAELALDAALFRRELGMFLERYVQAYRHRLLAEGQEQILRARLAELAEAAASGPQCVQHRDFHSRNLVHLHRPAARAEEIGWLDHQDLRRGPLYYDLASLWTDAYVDLPEAVRRLLHSAVPAWGSSHELTSDAAAERFHLSALQRVLKALGTFGNLLAQGRAEYQPAEARARRLALGLFDNRPEIFPDLRELVA